MPGMSEGPRGTQQLGTEPPYGPIACPCPSHTDTGRPSHRAARGPYIGPEVVEVRLHIRTLLLLLLLPVLERVLLVALYVALSLASAQAMASTPLPPSLSVRLVPTLGDAETRAVAGLVGSKSNDPPFFCPACDQPTLIFGIAVRGDERAHRERERTRTQAHA